VEVAAKISVPKVGVILPAGGKGLRVGGTEAKQFLPLGLGGGSGIGKGARGGKPMLLYTIEAFHYLTCVECIVLVLPRERMATYAKLLATYPKVKLTEGGLERWESVRNGFQALPTDLPFVLIHDVARPFVTETIIERCLAAATEEACVIAAQPAADTVKEVSGSTVTKTLDRRQLILVQTPQVFPRTMLAAMYALPPADNAPTDEAQLAERAGFEVRWVLGGESNRKVTGAEDLAWAEWMAGRIESGENFPEV
jgi:2-C-methyl-D-erythritol 4-phosphate cytidylyltransferase